MSMNALVQAMAGAEADQVTHLVSQLLGSDKFDGENLDALLFISDQCRRVGRADLAISCLTRAQEHFEVTAPLFEKFGYSFLDIDEDDAAETAFRCGLELDADGKGLQLGLYHCHVRSGDSAAAIEAIAPLFDWDGMYHPPGVVKTLLPAAHKAYMEGVRLPLRNHFLFLKKYLEDDQLVTIRLADILNANGEFEQSRELTRDTEQTLAADPWCAAIMTETLIGLGEMEHARRLSMPLLSREDFHSHFLNVFLRSYPTGGDEPMDVNAVMAQFTSATPETQALAGLLVHLKARDLTGAVAAYKSNPAYLRGASPYSIIDLAYALLTDGQNSLALEICKELRQEKQLPNPTEMLYLNILFAVQDWNEAAAVIDGMMANSPELGSELDLKRFELACFTGNWEVAEEMHGIMMADPSLVARYLPSILRFYAEKKEWNTICDTMLTQRPQDFQFEQIGMIVFRAFTDTNRVPEAIDWISGAGALKEYPDLRQLRASLIDELASDHRSIKQALSDSDVKAFPVIRRRLELKRGMLARIESDEANRTDVVYFCTNKSYRCGTAVAVTSLIRSNPELVQNSQIQIITDEEDGVSIEVFSRMGEQHGVDIDVLSAGDFITDFENLDASYGIFTSGFQLSQSAYYRIFFAKYLQEKKNVGRAAYFDSDVLITGDVSPLFDMNLNDLPLAARREVIRPEILKASAMHGIEPEDYFNSGVLLFDMVHPEMGDCLDRTITAVYNDELLFHDQCALNIGFAHEVKYIDERYNYFMPPSAKENPAELDVDVVHYLDRPKPWNAAYTSAAGLVWLDNLDALSSDIGSDLVSKMFLK